MATPPQSHEDLSQVLARAGVAADAAELHGGLCGSLCAGGNVAAEGWLTEWMRASNVEATATPDLQDALRTLRLQSWQALSGSGLTIQPLLPDDEGALAVRVAALADWCHGFIAGLALSGVGADGIANDDIAEIVSDFAQISRAGVDEDDDSDDDDFRFAELVEYVRVSVQIVFEDMAADRAEPAAATLH